MPPNKRQGTRSICDNFKYLISPSRKARFDEYFQVRKGGLAPLPNRTGMIHIHSGRGVNHPSQPEKVSLSRSWTSVLHQLEFCAETSTGTVVEGAKLKTVDVVLNITRIPMVCDVED